MVKVSVLYPNEEGKSFDMAYYRNKHFPLVQQLFVKVWICRNRWVRL